MSKPSEETVGRLAVVPVAQLVVACDALVARLRRIHQAADLGTSERASIDRAHTENVEALLSFLSVVRATTEFPKETERLTAALNGILESARTRGICAVQTLG